MITVGEKTTSGLSKKRKNTKNPDREFESKKRKTTEVIEPEVQLENNYVPQNALHIKTTSFSEVSVNCFKVFTDDSLLKKIGITFGSNFFSALF